MKICMIWHILPSCTLWMRKNCNFLPLSFLQLYCYVACFGKIKCSGLSVLYWPNIMQICMIWHILPSCTHWMRKNCNFQPFSPSCSIYSYVACFGKIKCSGLSVLKYLHYIMQICMIWHILPSCTHWMRKNCNFLPLCPSCSIYCYVACFGKIKCSGLSVLKYWSNIMQICMIWHILPSCTLWMRKNCNFQPFSPSCSIYCYVACFGKIKCSGLSVLKYWSNIMQICMIWHILTSCTLWMRKNCNF